MRTDSERDITARAILVLNREARRSAESAERVRLVTAALALRYGVSEPGEPSRQSAREAR